MAEAVQKKFGIKHYRENNAASPEHEGDGDTQYNSKGKDSNCKELFLRSLQKKANIYTTLPIPLSTPWSFWIDRTQHGMNFHEYEASLKKIHTVYSIHVFWGVYYNIPQPSTLKPQTSLHLTRENRMPIWEKGYNSKGGTFRFRLEKKDTDKAWMELLMATVGEQLNEFVAPGDEICGISVSIRPRDNVIFIWNQDASLFQESRVFDCVQMILPDTPFIAQFYKPHSANKAFEKEKAYLCDGGQTESSISALDLSGGASSSSSSTMSPADSK